MSAPSDEWSDLFPFESPIHLAAALRVADLGLACETALVCVGILEFASASVKAYGEGRVVERNKEKPYQDIDFLTAAAETALSLDQPDIGRGLDALFRAEALLASTNSRPIRRGEWSYSSAGELVGLLSSGEGPHDISLMFNTAYTALCKLADERIIRRNQELAKVDSSVLEMMDGLPEDKWRLVTYDPFPLINRHPHLEDEHYLDAVSKVNVAQVAQVIERWVADLDTKFLIAQLKIEFSRAAAFQALLGVKPHAGAVSLAAVSRVTESRDNFIYRQCCKGTPYKELIQLLREKFGERDCRPITTEEGVRQAALRYAERRQLDPPPPRQNL